MKYLLFIFLSQIASAEVSCFVNGGIAEAGRGEGGSGATVMFFPEPTELTITKVENGFVLKSSAGSATYVFSSKHKMYEKISEIFGDKK